MKIYISMDIEGVAGVVLPAHGQPGNPEYERARRLMPLVREGFCVSLTEAATRFALSHPAMSKSLRSLESEVGVSLIRRSPRGVVCTSAGQIFFARARAIRAELRKAQEELEQMRGEHSSRKENMRKKRRRGRVHM